MGSSFFCRFQDAEKSHRYSQPAFKLTFTISFVALHNYYSYLDEITLISIFSISGSK